MNDWNVDATMILTRDEIAAVLADCQRKAKRSINTRQNLIIFRLATCCGLRASEIASLQLRDIHVDNTPRPWVQVTNGKGGKNRRVPLWWDKGTLADLRGWKLFRAGQGAKPTDPLICTQATGKAGSPLHRNNIRLRFKAACTVLGKARVDTLTVHHGRHSFVSHALAGGRSLAEVRDAAGHANISTTSIYTHIAVDDDSVGSLFEFSR